jgi:hypothetical protein
MNLEKGAKKEVKRRKEGRKEGGGRWRKKGGGKGERRRGKGLDGKREGRKEGRTEDMERNPERRKEKGAKTVQHMNQPRKSGKKEEEVKGKAALSATLRQWRSANQAIGQKTFFKSSILQKKKRSHKQTSRSGEGYLVLCNYETSTTQRLLTPHDK